MIRALSVLVAAVLMILLLALLMSGCAIGVQTEPDETRRIVLTREA